MTRNDGYVVDLSIEKPSVKSFLNTLKSHGHHQCLKDALRSNRTDGIFIVGQVISLTTLNPFKNADEPKVGKKFILQEVLPDGSLEKEFCLFTFRNFAVEINKADLKQGDWIAVVSPTVENYRGWYRSNERSFQAEIGFSHVPGAKILFMRATYQGPNEKSNMASRSDNACERSPHGTSRKSSYIYTKIADLIDLKSIYHVYGVVTDILKEPRMLSTNKYHAVVILRDESCTGVSPNGDFRLHIFSKHLNYPPIKKGDIVRAHRVKLEEYQNKVDGRIFDASWLLTFTGEESQSIKPRSTSSSYDFTDDDKIRVKELRKWSTSYWNSLQNNENNNASNGLHSNKNDNEATSKNPVRKLEDVKKAMVFDLYCQIAETRTVSDSKYLVMQVQDGTIIQPYCIVLDENASQMIKDSANLTVTLLNDRPCIDILVQNPTEEMKALKAEDFVLLKNIIAGEINVVIQSSESSMPYLKFTMNEMSSAEILDKRDCEKRAIKRRLKDLANPPASNSVDEHIRMLASMNSYATGDELILFPLAEDSPENHMTSSDAKRGGISPKNGMKRKKHNLLEDIPKKMRHSSTSSDDMYLEDADSDVTYVFSQPHGSIPPGRSNTEISVAKLPSSDDTFDFIMKNIPLTGIVPLASKRGNTSPSLIVQENYFSNNSESLLTQHTIHDSELKIPRMQVMPANINSSETHTDEILPLPVAAKRQEVAVSNTVERNEWATYDSHPCHRVKLEENSLVNYSQFSVGSRSRGKTSTQKDTERSPQDFKEKHSSKSSPDRVCDRDERRRRRANRKNEESDDEQSSVHVKTESGSSPVKVNESSPTQVKTNRKDAGSEKLTKLPKLKNRGEKVTEGSSATSSQNSGNLKTTDGPLRGSRIKNESSDASETSSPRRVLRKRIKDSHGNIILRKSQKHPKSDVSKSESRGAKELNRKGQNESSTTPAVQEQKSYKDQGTQVDIKTGCYMLFSNEQQRGTEVDYCNIPIACITCMKNFNMNAPFRIQGWITKIRERKNARTRDPDQLALTKFVTVVCTECDYNMKLDNYMKHSIPEDMSICPRSRNSQEFEEMHRVTLLFRMCLQVEDQHGTHLDVQLCGREAEHFFGCTISDYMKDPHLRQRIWKSFKRILRMDNSNDDNLCWVDLCLSTSVNFQGNIDYFVCNTRLRR